MNIDAGEFKHPIIIQRQIHSLDNDNIPIKKPKTILKTKAKIKNISGYEKIIANADTSIDKKRFYIRYKKGLDLNNDDLLLYNGKPYNITYVSDVEELHQYYEIVTKLVK